MNKIIKKRKLPIIFALALILSLVFGVTEVGASQTPSVTTHSATNISETSAVLNGYINPHDTSAQAWFVYGTSASNLSMSTSKVNIGSSSTQFNRAITGLTPGTTYYFKAIGENSCGQNPHDVRSFTTLDQETGQTPSVTTHSATSVNGNSAVLNGYINPHDTSAQAWFVYGTSASNLNMPTSKVNIGSSSAQFNRTITGLTPGTTYYFKAIGENSYGVNSGDVKSFTKPQEEDPVNGACGSRAKTYEHNQTNWPSGSFCSLGNSDPSNPSFPVKGESTTWICRGLKGGNDAYCSATRKSSPGASGNIECYSSTENSITLRYDFSNGSDVSLFYKMGTRLTIFGSGTSSGYYTHKNLVPGESYTYRLRNGLYSFFPLLDQTVCSTKPETEEPWGSLSCDSTTIDSVTLRYSYSDGSNVSLFRGNSRLNTWSESSRNNRIFTDSGLNSETNYTYYLRNGTSTNSSLLAHVTCRTEDGTHDPRISVIKNVRNITRNTGWGNSIEASPGHNLSFSIEVRSTGESELENVVVRDFLPERLEYVGNLTVDGSAKSGNILQGIDIGNIPAGSSRTIRFDVRVSSEEQFGVGWTNLINRARASASDISDTEDTAEVYVSRGEVLGVATRVSTGITNNKLIDFVLLPLMLTLIVWLFFRKYFVTISEWLETKKHYAADSRAKRSLEKVASEIRAKENSA